MRVLKWIGIVVGVVLLVALLVGGTLYFMGGRVLARTYADVPVREVPIPSDAAAIARGEHLVHHVNLCVDCHGDNLQGTLFIDDPAFMHLPAPNLTSGQGGIGGAAYTDSMWVRALTQGVGGDDRGLLIMPATHYHALNDADLGAVVAYLKQLPPQNNELGKRTAGPIGHIVLGLGGIEPEPNLVKDLPAATTIAPAANAEYGAYMVTIAGCAGCHGDNLAGGTDTNAPLGPNITTTLLGTWTEEQFVNFMRTGTLPTGGNVADVMPWQKYSGMDDTELKAIFAHLQTTPALPDNK